MKDFREFLRSRGNQKEGALQKANVQIYVGRCLRLLNVYSGLISIFKQMNVVEIFYGLEIGMKSMMEKGSRQ